MKVRLLIADDHTIVKQTISFWLTQHDQEVSIVGLAPERPNRGKSGL